MSDEEKGFDPGWVLMATALGILVTEVIIFGYLYWEDGWVVKPVFHEVVLTPGAPRSGDCWIEIRDGYNDPSGPVHADGSRYPPRIQ